MKVVLIYIIVGCLVLMPWIWNAKKLTDCDFASNFKCELIHGIGVVILPMAYFTVWFDSDK